MSNIACLIIPFVFLFILVILIKREGDLLSFFSVYSLCYWVVFFLGIPIYFILETQFYFSPYDYKSIYNGLLISIVGYFIFYVSYKTKLFKDIKSNISIGLSLVTIKIFAYLCIISTIIATFSYAIKNGGLVLLNSSGYEARLESNLGGGLFTIFFPMFILGLSILFYLKPSRLNWYKLFIIGISIGSLIFVAIGGARMNIALFICVFVVVGYKYNIIPKSIFFLSPFVIVCLLTGMAFLRDSGNADDKVFIFLIYLMNSFSPFDALNNINDYYLNGGLLPGFTVIYQQTLLLLPRFIFPDKPEMIMNVGNFYTQEILNYKSNLTMSPTINGSYILVGGYSALAIGSFLLGKFIRFLDRQLYYKGFFCVNNNQQPQVCFRAGLYSFYIFYMFNLVRESLDIFMVSRIIIPFFIFTMLFFISIILTKSLKK